jgi:hypothetical protein
VFFKIFAFFFGYVISFDSFLSKEQQYLLILSLTLVPSHWCLAQRVVSDASDLSASMDLFHGYGDMKDPQDRTAYHFISLFLLVVILHRPGRDIIQGRCELSSSMWWFLFLLYNTCDSRSLRIRRDFLIQFDPKLIHLLMYPYMEGGKRNFKVTV